VAINFAIFVISKTLFLAVVADFVLRNPNTLTWGKSQADCPPQE
jgi:sorbitol-specific phosphotransferase system component IIC